MSRQYLLDYHHSPPRPFLQGSIQNTSRPASASPQIDSLPRSGHDVDFKRQPKRDTGVCFYFPRGTRYFFFYSSDIFSRVCSVNSQRVTCAPPALWHSAVAMVAHRIYQLSSGQLCVCISVQGGLTCAYISHIYICIIFNIHTHTHTHISDV